MHLVVTLWTSLWINIMENKNLITLFNSWLNQDKKSVVELLNKDKKLVVVLYLDQLFNSNLTPENITVVETVNVDEKYYLFINGIGIFFTYFKKGE